MLRSALVLAGAAVASAFAPAALPARATTRGKRRSGLERLVFFRAADRWHCAVLEQKQDMCREDMWRQLSLR
jgi:hypothetical protein